MMLQEIVKNFNKKSWLRLCTLHGHDKWDLIDLIKEPVFANKHLIDQDYQVKTRTCNHCGKKLDLGIYLGSFIVKKTCKCGQDGTQLTTVEKLSCTLSPDQAKTVVQRIFNERTKGLPNTLYYWTNQGFSESEAKEKISNVQKNRSAKSPAARKGARGYSVRTIEYWTSRGYSKTEAKEKIKEVQTTNGLEYYLKKYGPAGKEMFDQRIEKWLSSDGNKKMITGRSKNSIELFEKLGLGYYGKNEKTVRGETKVHRVDFLYDNKIIEFFGDYWHGNPKIFSKGSMIRKKPIEEVWEHDRKKIADLENKNYQVLVVWEKDYQQEPEKILNECKKFLQI